LAKKVWMADAALSIGPQTINDMVVLRRNARKSGLSPSESPTTPRRARPMSSEVIEADRKKELSVLATLDFN